MKTLKTKIYSLMAFLIGINFPNKALSTETMQHLQERLEQTLDKSDSFNKIREDRISGLTQLRKHATPLSNEEYKINSKLYTEYKSYQSDSAIYYKNRNIEIAQILNNTSFEYDSKIDLAYLFGSIGMYKEAIDLLQSLNVSLLNANNLVSYHYTYLKVYSELAYYTQDKRASVAYWETYNNHMRLLKQNLKKNDDLYLELLEDSLRNTQNYEKSLKINDILLKKAKPGTHEYAIVTFRRSLTYICNGDKENQQYYLTLSAISDTQSAVKDQASLMMLAAFLYDKGEIEIAYKYIRLSWSATQHYNAKLRSLQNSTILSLVDKTYQSKIESQNTQLQLYLILISSLVVLLLITLLIIHRQKQKITLAKIELQNANKELNYLNKELNKLNSELKTVNDNLFITNQNLNESNRIKEVYVGRFIELCSIYINKIDDFRRKINSSLKAGKIKEANIMTHSRDIMDEEFAELYANFDSAFLQLFPNFVHQVNDLLNVNDRFELKNGEALLPELRIIALMRLGINEGNKISQFLRYSLTTVYNYRTKTKNRTFLAKEEFDKRILEIE